MPLNRKLISLGASVAFVLNGTTVTNDEDPAVVSELIKPDGSTPADWAVLSRSTQVGFEVVVDEEDVFAPAPGAYRRVDEFVSMLSLDVKITGIDTNEHVFRTLFQTGAIVDGTEFTLQAGLGQLYGWMRIVANSQRDVQALEIEVYGILKVKTMTADGKRMPPEFMFKVLHNSLNKGTSTLAAA